MNGTVMRCRARRVRSVEMALASAQAVQSIGRGIPITAARLPPRFALLDLALHRRALGRARPTHDLAHDCRRDAVPLREVGYLLLNLGRGITNQSHKYVTL